MKQSLMEALVAVGEIVSGNDSRKAGERDQIITEAAAHNAWFTPLFINRALEGVGNMLKKEHLTPWVSTYDIHNEASKRVGVVSAGNIPMVGFHDFLCVLVSGHHYAGKLSKQDDVLLPWVASLLIECYPQIAPKVHFSPSLLSGYDAVIATGSNNTFRYFEYYFRDVPSILRKNRNSMAIIRGTESREELNRLADDIFLYFGKGCRSVSKIAVPEGYDMARLFEALEDYRFVSDHFKYHNNYDYYKSIYLVNRVPHLDNGYVLMVPDQEGLASPVSVVYYSTYVHLSEVEDWIGMRQDDIQCVVGSSPRNQEVIPFGQSQNPSLFDYSDGIDTMKWLIHL